MSATSVEVTELPQRPVVVRLQVFRTQRRGAHRVARTTARRTRQRWSIFSAAILACTFGLTVGILDGIH